MLLLLWGLFEPSEAKNSPHKRASRRRSAEQRSDPAGGSTAPPATVAPMLCRWCERREATQGAACAECVVAIATQTFGLLDALADLSDVAIEHDHVIELQPLGRGRWLASITPPARSAVAMATGADLLSCITQLRDQVRAAGLQVIPRPG